MRAGGTIGLVMVGSLALVGYASGQAQAPTPTSGRSPLVLVVARESPLQDLSTSSLRQLFLGESVQDPAGGKLVPLNQLPGSADRVAFDRSVLGMSPEEAGRYWIDRKIRGQSGAPRAIPSAATLQRLVARFPGSIAYLRADRVDPAVRVLRIAGRLPIDKDYPLAESAR